MLDRRLCSADRWVLLVLIVLPLLMFVLPALFNRSVVPGDDFTQNIPLRAFVGSQIRHGHLPLYNAYIWSGAPLLGGWNAGAAYPLTLLFVIIPATAAWAMNLVITWWVAGIGTFAFLRASRLSSVPSLLGSLSFAFAGAMSAQVVHFGLVAGMSWVPLALLALLRLSQIADAPRSPPDRRARLRSALGWAAVLGLAVGLTVLAGEPRAISNAAVVLAIYGLWRAIRLGTRALPFAALATGGLVLATCLGAVQWLTGIHAVHSSQRATDTAYLFTSGSLPLKWLLVLLVPDLLGGSGSFGQPPFLAMYNLTEIVGYVGLMPLAAALALLAKLRWRRPLPEWIVWHVMVLVGILLTLGGSTPLWHVLIHLPLFGSQRLQSRNIVIADLGLAFLLAYWSESWLARAKGRRGERGQMALAAIPGLACVATVVVGIAWGAGLLQWLGVDSAHAAEDGGLRMWFVPFAVLGIASVLLVVTGRRLAPRRRAQALVTFVVADILTFTFMAVVAVAAGIGQPPTTTSSASQSTVPGAGHKSPLPSPGPTAGPPPLPGASVPSPPTLLPASVFTGNGRFVVYDPDFIDNIGLTAIGAPDLNVIDGVPSAQGYSSIVDGTYASATGTHQATGLGQNVLDPAALANGTFDQLATTVLFAPRDYLTVTKPTDVAAADLVAGQRRLAPNSRATWYLGANLLVRSVSIPDAAAASDARSGIRIGLATTDGHVVFLPPPTARGANLTAASAAPQAAVALIVEGGPTPLALGAPSLTSADGTGYLAAGQLQGAVIPPHWVLRAIDGSFAVFANRLARPALTLRPLPTHGTTGEQGSGAASHAATASSATGEVSPGPPGTSIRRIAGSAASPSAASVSSQRGVEVVRAVSAVSGWHATWHPEGAEAIALPVRRAGLVQRVDVPAGTGTLAWTYDPPGWSVGWKLTVGGLAVLVLVAGWAAADRRRRSSTRMTRVRPRPHPPSSRTCSTDATSDQ